MTMGLRTGGLRRDGAGFARLGGIGRALYLNGSLSKRPSIAGRLGIRAARRLRASVTAGMRLAWKKPVLTEQDIYLFREGTHYRAYEKLGAHPVTRGTDTTRSGTHFGVWAPNAARVSVVGDFNDWNPESHPLDARADGSGIWAGFAPGVQPGALYKYHIVSKHRGYRVDKSDPFAFRCETPPRTASVVWDLGYEWGDDEWMGRRARANALDAPWSIYEVHPGSW